MWRFFFLAAALSACTQFPELDVTVPASAKNAPFPELKPLEPLLAPGSRLASDNAQTEATLAARVAALRTRAAGLRGNVIDPQTRTRMRAGVDTG